MEWSKLIGKAIIAFRGHSRRIFGEDRATLNYILLDDGKSFIALNEQDGYDYHDFNTSARTLTLQEDAAQWTKMLNKDGYLECVPGSDPF